MSAPSRTAAPTRLADLAPWRDDVDPALVCVARRETTHDVATFILAAPGGRRFEFLPGQYLTVAATIDGRRVERCYSISSPPTRPHTVSITVKRTTGGLMSNWLHDNLFPGTTVEAGGPLGRFACLPESGGKYLFISAGSGITPMLSMVRTAADLFTDADIVFIHSARTSADIAFRAELDHIAATGTRLSLELICTREPTSVRRGRRGRLHGDALAAICPDLDERSVFVCGPDAFMGDIRESIAAQSFPMDSYHQESFVLPTPASALATSASGPADETAVGHPVHFARRQRSVVCAPGQNILDAAAAAGISLPSSCGAGMCGTCKAPKLAGDVAMDHQGGIRQREIDAGKVLLCCARPTSEVTIDA